MAPCPPRSAPSAPAIPVSIPIKKKSLLCPKCGLRLDDSDALCEHLAERHRVKDLGMRSVVELEDVLEDSDWESEDGVTFVRVKRGRGRKRSTRR